MVYDANSGRRLLDVPGCISSAVSGSVDILACSSTISTFSQKIGLYVYLRISLLSSQKFSLYDLLVVAYRRHIFDFGSRRRLEMMNIVGFGCIWVHMGAFVWCGVSVYILIITALWRFDRGSMTYFRPCVIDHELIYCVHSSSLQFPFYCCPPQLRKGEIRFLTASVLTPVSAT